VQVVLVDGLDGVAGDRDLAEAVRAAQDAGRRVVLAHPHGAGVAGELRELADEVVTIERETIQGWFEIRERRDEAEGEAEEEEEEEEEEEPEVA
jgi:uncharacterized LabA/DUF88 family protein